MARSTGWFEEYACGCVSDTEKRQKDLPGYCPQHGDDRRRIFPVFDVEAGAKPTKMQERIEDADPNR